jgi:opacity protein-like surface antigen
MAGTYAKRWAVVGSALACAALIAALAASPAAAFHIPGAGYSGDVSGGGTISFTVSSDGSSVTNLTLQGPIERPGCTLSSAHYDQIPIANNAFNNGQVSGGFPNPRGAYGRFDIPVSTSCRVTGTWSAITEASPNGSAECKAAQAQVKKAKRALSKAKRTGNQKKIKRLRKKWSKARSLRDKYCI